MKKIRKSISVIIFLLSYNFLFAQQNSETEIRNLEELEGHIRTNFCIAGQGLHIFRSKKVL